MTGQGVLFGSTMSEKFQQFHVENPRVYEVLVRLARQWINATSRHKLGIPNSRNAPAGKSPSHQRPRLQTQQQLRSYYARLIMHQEPDLDDLFDVRVSEADDWLQEQWMF